MLKSADLHETILTPVICHKHVRYHDGVTPYFSKEDEKWIFLIDVSTFPLSEVKITQKKRGKLRLNACKHWESESINRNLSAAVIHVKNYGRFAYGSFRLRSVRLRLICQFAYVLKHVLQELIHLLYVRSRSDTSRLIQFLERDSKSSLSKLNNCK